MTRMARLAATEHGADWVVNCDADELWWPRAGPLREVLAAVPSRFGAIRGMWRHFVPRPGNGDVFERMTVRRRPSPDLADPYHAQVKVAHRGAADVAVSKGNHDAEGTGLRLIREWFPFEVLHFPIRSRDQLERKYRITAEAEADATTRAWRVTFVRRSAGSQPAARRPSTTTWSSTTSGSAQGWPRARSSSTRACAT